MKQNLKSHPVMSISIKSPWINVPARGISVQQHTEESENLPDDIRVSIQSDDAGLKERFFFDNIL